ncbi:hypothetical protein [Streptomyces sp. NPDC005969]|uniref:hypothetical protein n=1 Tax=Streptomyces sp. NPDC005969 TaxID=3156722 RepID=UPI0033CB3A31
MRASPTTARRKPLPGDGALVSNVLDAIPISDAGPLSGSGDEIRSPESLAPKHVDLDHGKQVVDLMAAQDASVKKARESRAVTGEGATVHEMKPRRKRP